MFDARRWPAEELVRGPAPRLTFRGTSYRARRGGASCRRRPIRSTPPFLWVEACPPLRALAGAPVRGPQHARRLRRPLALRAAHPGAAPQPACGGSCGRRLSSPAPNAACRPPGCASPDLLNRRPMPHLRASPNRLAARRSPIASFLGLRAAPQGTRRHLRRFRSGPAPWSPARTFRCDAAAECARPPRASGLPHRPPSVRARSLRSASQAARRINDRPRRGLRRAAPGGRQSSPARPPNRHARHAAVSAPVTAPPERYRLLRESDALSDGSWPARRPRREPRPGGTFWELAGDGLPALLVPYSPMPLADHQAPPNAEHFASAGGAVIVETRRSIGALLRTRVDEPPRASGPARRHARRHVPHRAAPYAAARPSRRRAPAPWPDRT